MSFLYISTFFCVDIFQDDSFVNVTVTGTAASDIATLWYSLIDVSADAQPKPYFSDVVEGGFTTIATNIKDGDAINVSFSLPVADDFVAGATPDYQNVFLAQDPAEKSFLYLSNVAVDVSFSALPLNQSDYTTFEVDGIYYYKGETGLSVCNRGDNSLYSGSITIPSSVTYEDKTYQVTAIRDSAFNDCAGLTSIIIPESVTTIGVNAFTGCSGLTNIIIPEGVTTILESAFAGCSGLTSILIPETVTYIGESVFSGCSGLQYIICNGEPAECGENVFGQEGSLAETKIYANASLLVPKEYKQLYSIKKPWSNFSITEINLDPIELANDTITITAQETQVLVTWTQIENSNSYTLVITVAGEVYITLNYNAEGQLIGIELPSSLKSYAGLQFAITGLKSNTEYEYTLYAKDVNDNVLKSYTGSFKTLGETAITEVGEEQNAISVINNTITCTVESFKIYNVLGQNVTAENGNLKAGVYMVVSKYGSQKVVVQ